MQNITTKLAIWKMKDEAYRHSQCIMSHSRVAGRSDRCLQKKCWSLFGQLLSGFAPDRPGKGNFRGHSPHDTGEQTRSKISFLPCYSFASVKMIIGKRKHIYSLFLQRRAELDSQTASTAQIHARQQFSPQGLRNKTIICQ